MKKMFYLFIFSIIVSCQKTEMNSSIPCVKEELNLIPQISHTMIPISNQNFWVYADSIWTNDTLEQVRSTLFNIEHVYVANSDTSIKLNLFGELTIKGDTLYRTRGVFQEEQEGDCNDLTYPFLFYTEDSVLIEEEPFDKYLLKSKKIIQSPLGELKSDVLFKEGNSFEVFANKKLGIIRIVFWIGDRTSKRRSLTLKDYYVAD